MEGDSATNCPNARAMAGSNEMLCVKESTLEKKIDIRFLSYVLIFLECTRTFHSVSLFKRRYDLKRAFLVSSISHSG